jgi:HEAT repeat protein
MRLLFDFLGETYPPRRIFETLRTRDDHEFIAALLRWLPKSPSATQTANLKQIEAVTWLEEPERIADLPEGLQGQVSAFVLATGLPEARKTEIQEWLVRNASAEGRRGAAQVFDRLDLETTKRILLDSLDSQDEDVSAWATSQLRTRHVPGAFRLLVDRLDSGSTTVQKAARDELRGFTIEHLIAISDRLTPTLCRQAGRLVRKVDPDCVAKLAAMISSPFQRQRIAAAQSVVRLGMVEELREALLGLLEDEDNMIRRIGVEILAEDRTPEVLAAIRELASDPSPRVRQAVERALAGKQPAMAAGVT